jgi:hypothetical protein
MAIFVKVTDENIHGMYVQTEKRIVVVFSGAY